jgi:hypothetical protein
MVDFSDGAAAVVAALASSGESTDVLACPVQMARKYFCKEAGTAIAASGIIAHFYRIALIGLGIIVCRRRGGIVPMHPEKDEPSATHVSELGRFMRSTEPTSRLVAQPSTDPESDSQSWSFDMDQQSRAGIN